MKKICLLLLISFILYSCARSQATPTPENTNTPIASITPSQTSTSTSTPTISLTVPVKPSFNPTNTRLPTETPTPSATPTVTPLPSATPTPTPITYVRDHQHIPQPEVPITGVTVSEMVEIARLGYGAIQSIQNAPNNWFTLVQTPLGVHAYAPGTLDEIWKFEVNDPITALAASARGWVALGSATGEVYLLSSTSGNLISHSSLQTTPISKMAFSDQGDTLAVGGEEGELALWQILSGIQYKLLSELEFRDQVYFLGFSVGDTLLMVNHSAVFDTKNGELLRELPDDSTTAPKLNLYYVDSEVRRISDDEIVLNGLEAPGYSNMDFYNAVFSPNGEYFALAAEESYYSIWRIADGSHVMTVDVDGGYGFNQKPIIRSGPTPIHQAVFSPDGKYLVLEGSTYLSFAQSEMIIINLESSTIEAQFPVHWGGIFFTPQGRKFYFAQDDSIELYEVPSGERIDSIFWGWSESNIFFSPGTTRLAFGGQIWHLQNATINHLPERERIIGFSENGSYIYNIRKMWWVVSRRTDTLEIHHQFELEYPQDDPDWFNNQDILYWNELTKWSIPPDGSIVAGTSWNVWFAIPFNPKDGELIKIIDSFTDLPHFSPDGDLIGYDYPDELNVYSNLLDGEITPTFSFETGPVYDVYFDQNDQIFTLSENEIKLFSYPDGELINTYPINGVDYYWENSLFAISSDNRVAVVGSHENIVIWDLVNQTSITEFNTSYGWITSLTFSSDGRYLAVGTDQGILHLYGIKP